MITLQIIVKIDDKPRTKPFSKLLAGRCFCRVVDGKVQTHAVCIKLNKNRAQRIDDENCRYDVAGTAEVVEVFLRVPQNQRVTCPDCGCMDVVLTGDSGACNTCPSRWGVLI